MAEVSGVNGAQTAVQPVKITIKKNQGITQALFDLVKNENLSDGKIDSTEWANALGVLNEIQASREQNGQKSIYSGGAGNDGHKNYIVHEGDQIEFTAEEIQKLYDALGVTLKDGKSPQPVDRGVQTGGVEEKPTQLKADPPKSQAPKNLRKTDCPGVFYDEATKTHYKIENGKYVEFKGAHGGKVRTVYEDGGYVECFYYENGKQKIVEINAKGQIDEAKDYNEQGRLTKETKFINGKPDSTSSYTYNADGSYTERFFIHNIGMKENEITYYDKNNRKKGGKLPNGTTWTTKYLSDGSQLRTFVQKDGTKYYFMTKNGNEYRCDANGKPIK